MTKHFVISTDEMTGAQEKALIKSLNPVSWWHWLPNFWLVKDSSDRLSVAIIRDLVHEINSTVRCIVLQVEPVTWAALSREDSAGRDMTDWIRNNWKRPPRVPPS